VTDNELTYGLVAEFEDPTTLVRAAKRVRESGYRKFEIYSPYPIKALDKIVPGGNLVPFLTLAGGLIGAATAWVLQYFVAAIEYPVNVGGRPLYSWPSFIPILFEMTVLLSAALCFFGTLGLCGFPRINHPVFNLPRFAEASSGRYFLAIEAKDPVFDARLTAEFLQTLGSAGVWEVDNS
jgi:hypothetical protein